MSAVAPAARVAPEAGRGWIVLLAGLPGMAPPYLARLLDRWPPAEAWARATAGRRDALAGVFRRHEASGDGASIDSLVGAWAARRGPGEGEAAEALARHRDAGVDVVLRDDPAYPSVLVDDPSPPPVLFVRGDLGSLADPRVAVVGTRRCTGGGATVARGLGRELAEAGVGVVSGLALGIDGAAHRGALDAAAAAEGEAGAPIGVVGCGHDRPYPRRHARLWEEVAAAGALLGEAPLGVGPTSWRFPLRNRIIAALADVVVVVESHDAGGSLVTVRAAIDRGRDVMAVPGSVRNPAAAGTNQLLADGCHPVRDARDVLAALGLRHAGRGVPPERSAANRLDAEARAVLEAFDWEPATLEHLALRTGQPVPQLALTIQRLEADGWVAGPGPWYERVARR